MKTANKKPSRKRGSTSRPPTRSGKRASKTPTTLQATRLKVLTWNVAGAKFLEKEQGERSKLRKKLNVQLRLLLQELEPDFVLLQEIVRYGKDESHADDLVDRPDGYKYKPSRVIDTNNHSHPRKWLKYFERGGWPKGTYLAQGLGILWRDDILHGNIWEFEPIPQFQQYLYTEEVYLQTGLYTGDRDTEPRVAVVAHFILSRGKVTHDVFLVNLHLTTLKGEREGKPRLDSEGAQIRMNQIEAVFHGIVSRHTEWLDEQPNGQKVERGASVWILGGDFNCTPNSPTIARIKAMNFLDLNPEKGTGSKRGRVGHPASDLTLDYLFAGPKYIAFDHLSAEREVLRNPEPLHTVSGKNSKRIDLDASDHFPVFGSFTIPDRSSN